MPKLRTKLIQPQYGTASQETQLFLCLHGVAFNIAERLYLPFTVALESPVKGFCVNLFTTDHKVIGRGYFFLSLAAVLVGAWLSLLMRIHLVWPHAAIPFLGEIKPENYLAQLTMHGTLMVFFVLSTVPQAGFGTFFLPLQLGASNMAFPRLTTSGFWTALVSFFVLMAAFFVPGGASGAGWTQYPPLSALASAGPGQGLGTDLWLISIGLSACPL